MPSKTKTALAALFILGPVSVVVLAGPNNRIDDRGSVRAVSAPISTGRAGVVNHAAKLLAGEEKPWQSEKCYWWGRCDIINDENTRLRN
jgi:hypothetical protein